MKNNIIATSILSLGIACAAEQDASTCPPIPAGKTAHYHGVKNAVEIYKMESQKAEAPIERAFSMWKASPESFTQEAFWRFLQNLGKKRRAIAEKCKSEDIESFGELREDRLIFTQLTGYSIMQSYVMEDLKRYGDEKPPPITIADRKDFKEKMNTVDLKKAKFYEANPGLHADQKALIKACETIISEVFNTSNKAERADVEHRMLMESGGDGWPENKDVYLIKQSFYERDELSRVFYAGVIGINVYIHLCTVNSAEHDSPAMSELYNLFKTFVSEQTPEAAFAFFHKFAITMPYGRGSCAVNEWILAAACKTINIPMPQQSVFAEFDQKAQISTRADFIAYMMKKIT